MRNCGTIPVIAMGFSVAADVGHGRRLEACEAGRKSLTAWSTASAATVQKLLQRRNRQERHVVMPAKKERKQDMDSR